MTETAFLGVETSLSGRRWVGPGLAQERAALTLQQRADVSPALAQVLARQGVAPDGVASWLAPALRDQLPDPRVLKDMDIAGPRLARAVARREKVAVFGDYDVDGAASAALLLDWFSAFDMTATLHIPDRITEGYGPNPDAMAALTAAHDLVILVDCGTLGHEAIAAGKGADILVLDHHQGGETLPDCLAVVNPNRQDEDGSLGMLCAAGVVFLALVDAGRELRAQGITGPDLMVMLDLVALATVADVARLEGVNRAFVRQGLKVMARAARPGLVALAEVSRLSGPITAASLGFAFGPRINAGGRIGRADLGTRLLATRDKDEAQSLAERLNGLNGERRAMEDAQRAEAMAQAQTRDTEGALVWAAGDGWHPGVIGIIAARLKEAFGRPAVVIALEGAEGKGSGRSIEGVDLGASVARLVAEGLLLKGGGHAMAAGLSVARESVEPAMARLSELLKRQGADQSGPRDLRLDGAIMAEGMSARLIDELEQAGPFGAGAPAPRFALPAQVINDCRIIGERHLKLRLAGRGPEVVAFGVLGTPLGDALQNAGRSRIHLAGRLELNHWQGRVSVQLRLEDAALA